jgi:hypothetical protein
MLVDDVLRDEPTDLSDRPQFSDVEHAPVIEECLLVLGDAGGPDLQNGVEGAVRHAGEHRVLVYGHDLDGIAEFAFDQLFGHFGVEHGSRPRIRHDVDRRLVAGGGRGLGASGRRLGAFGGGGRSRVGGGGSTRIGSGGGGAAATGRHERQGRQHQPYLLSHMSP